MTGQNIPPSFFEELRECYEEQGLEDYWEEEKPILTDVIPQIVDEIGDKFELREPLDVGGGGVVSVVYDSNIKERRVLKVSRPSPGKVSLLGDLLTAEKQNLLRLSNQNLIRIYEQGEVAVENEEYPYYIMQFVEGPDGSGIEADDYLATDNRTTKEVLDLLYGVIKAVDYLHQQDTVHMDIKPENILVNENGNPLITDLGFAKHLDFEDATEETRIGGTQGYIHPEVDEYIHVSQSDPNRVRGHVSREKLKERGKNWDLYSLGKTFLELLEKIEQSNPNILDTYHMRYLRLLSCRLLDGKNDPDRDEGQRALGISVAAYRDIKYENISQVRRDFEKLIGLYDLTVQIPELDFSVQTFGRASTISDAPFTNRVQTIVNNPYVSRLGGFTQLGLLYLIHHSATHSRLEHTIGTYSIVCRYIHSLYDDPHNPLFRQIMNKEDIESILLASLLLDIGQFPLAHEINEADPSIQHENIRDRILSNPPSDLEDGIAEEWNATMNRVKSVLDADPKRLDGTIKDRILISLLNGPLGADRVDHLLRDSDKLGLSYGNSIDVNQLVNNLTIVLRDEGGDTYASLGIHENGKIPAESVAFSHYALFGSVYWSHEFRGIKAMMHRLVWEGLEKGESGDADTFRKDLLDFVEPLGSTQTTLSRPEDYSASSSDMSQVHQADLEIIEWLAARSDDTGNHLCNMFKNINIFERIYVLTYEKTTNKDLWQEITDFFDRVGYEKKMEFQEKFQERIVRHIKDKEGKINYRTISAIEHDDVENFVKEQEHDRLLLLVDCPPTSRRLETKVEYLEEENSYNTNSDELEVESLTGTEIWDALRKKFFRSIGKIRVYCHPEYSELLSTILSRDEIQGSLRYGLNQVE